MDQTKWVAQFTPKYMRNVEGGWECKDGSLPW